MATDDTDRLAREIKGTRRGKVKESPVTRRKGVVSAVDATTGLASVKIGGETNAVPNIKSVSNYVPQVGDVVDLEVRGNGTPKIVERTGNGTTGDPVGPSVFSGVQADSVATSESITTTSYTNLTTFGPTVQVTISASGMAIVTIGANILTPSNSVGGAMAIAVGGATSTAADDTTQLATDGTLSGSRSVLLTGLNPGLTTFSAKYKSLNSGDTATFENRQIWAVPL